MLKFEQEIARAKVPAVLVCGIDAQTRSQTIERILESSETPWAVISNDVDGPEFAAVATERVPGQMVPHAIGCLCCVTRSGLVSSLRRLYALREQGELVFDQVVIETLPDADPASVMQTLLNNALVTEYFRLDSVVVAMADNGFDALKGSVYGFKQLSLADRIVLSRDLTNESALKERLRRLNPAAELVESDRSDLSRVVLGGGLESHLLAGDLAGWLSQTNYASNDRLEQGLHGFSIELETPLNWDAFHGWLNAGTQSNGDIMFRTKGAIKIAGFDAPILINGTQHVFQPPQLLPDVHISRSSMLFITHDLDRDAVETSLREDLPQFGRISESRAERAARVAMDPSIPL